VGKSLSTAGTSKPGHVGGHRGAGPGLGHSFGVGSSTGSAIAGPGGTATSQQLLKEQQKQERRKALLHVQSFLNPQNKPPAKTALVTSKIADASGPTLAKPDPRKNKDDS